MRLLAVAAALASLSGCAKSSQIVIGVVTDIPVPTTLQAVQLDAQRNGVSFETELFENLATQPGEPHALPGSFDFYSPRGGTPLVELTVTGYGSNLGTTLVERKAEVLYRSEEVLFMRLAIVQACVGKTCADGDTCVEGACVSESFDTKRLPKYRSELVSTIECDSGTQFIDTTTCGSDGLCDKLPIAGACQAGETCIEGTCYAAQ